MDALENAGFTPADITALGQFQNLPQIKAILVGQAVIKVAELLRKLTATKVSGTNKFVASKHLKQANVGWTNDNFNKLFLKKVEENVGDVTIGVHHLEKTSLSIPIMAELGDRAEIQLAHFFKLLKAQSKGQDGLLPTNGYATIAYIKGSDGNFWAVLANWHSDHGYWFVDACSVVYPYRWARGNQVLSRDS